MNQEGSYVKLALLEGLLAPDEVRRWASAKIQESSSPPLWLADVVMAEHTSLVELASLLPFEAPYESVALADIAYSCWKAGRITEGAMLGKLFAPLVLSYDAPSPDWASRLVSLLCAWDEEECPDVLPAHLRASVQPAFEEVSPRFTFQTILAEIS